MTIDLDKIFEFLNSLAGMPKCGLVFVCCLAGGFGLKKISWIHNSSIPGLVMFGGALLLPCLSDWPSSSLHSVRVFFVTQGVIGFITGTIAWLFHRWVIKGLLAKFGVKDSDFNSDPPFPKGGGSNVKTQTETKTP